MDYEFDESKSEWTLKERGIDFDFAARVFDSEVIEYEDTRRDYGERRYVAIGPIEGTLFAVSIPGATGAGGSSQPGEPTGRSAMPTVVRSRKRRARTGRVDWDKVRGTTDEDVARQIVEDPDTAPALTDDALDRAVVVGPDGRRTPYRERVEEAEEPA